MASASFAQAPTSPVVVRSSSSEGVTVAPGGVITAPFTIRNVTRDSIAIAQAIILPAGWTTVNSLAPATLAANAMELWLVSVAAPQGAPAGQYILRAGIVANGATVSDSVVVTIEERYALDVKATAAPTYVLAGSSYDATFIVRNAGNVSARVAIRATSNRGAKPKVDAPLMDLVPGAANTVTATVAVPGSLTSSQQDLLEIIAVDVNRDSVRATSSVETTIIAKNDGSDFWSVPGDLSIRAAAPGAGVSTVILTGTGRISQTSNTTVNFAIHSAPNGPSLFGERDEYRLGLTGRNASLRLGDNAFGFSTLTSSGSQGTGAELVGSARGLMAGAYAQRSRWLMNSGTELAATVGSSDEAVTGASLIALQRVGAAGTARVLSANARAAFLGMTLELEGAKSDSVRVAGTGGVVRLYGSAPTFTYDIGAQQASDAFAGPQRATADRHASVSGQKVGGAILSAMVATHTTRPTSGSNGYGQNMMTASLTASFMNGNAVEYDRFDRNDIGSAYGVHGAQHALRLRGRRSAGSLDFIGSVQNGIVAQRDSAPHGFASASLSVRANLSENQYLSAFADIADGRTLGGGGIGTLTGGANAEFRLGALTTVRLTTTMTAQHDNLAAWIGQADFTVERNVRRAIIALRGRFSQSGASATPSSNSVYLEVRTPLRLPTSRLNVGGRARARVIDAETGHGLPGALVRMGELAAVTDRNGVASFRGLESGQYHAIVEGGIAAGQLVDGGNVDVEAGGRTADFRLNVTRGARVQARLRRMERVIVAPSRGGAPDTEGDSLVDVGAVGQAVLALVSPRDTIWQSSDDRGRVDFGSIAPGRYTVRVVAGDVPEFTAFEKREVEITVAAGETREVELRLIPQIRAVQFMGEETVLVATPAPKVKAAPNPAPRQQQKNQRQQ